MLLSERAVPTGLGSAFSFLPGTYVPGYLIPPLRGWSRGAERRASPKNRIGLIGLLLAGGVLANLPPKNLTIAATGASGAVFLRHLLLTVAGDERVETVNFIASDSALRVMAEELDLKGRSNLIGQILGPLSGGSSGGGASGSRAARKFQIQANADIGANVASGSYPADAMIVIPCSVGTLARIANGIAAQLIERAADVSLKEKRPLVLCVRETPLNKIHIRNMYRAADAGATIFPLIPAFYYRPHSLDEMAHEFAYRVLAHVDLPHPQAFRWKG